MNEELELEIAQSAHSLGIEKEVFEAVIAVESSGKWFASVNGKQEPIIRFEGHYFDRRLTGIAQARARLRGLASPRPGAVKNPTGQSGRWHLLEKASAINRTAALESTSWGIGQVIGAHWKWLGYESIEAFVVEARSGAAGQLNLMARYIEKAGLVQALKNRDWSGFAKGYNGPAYVKNNYHLKMALAYTAAKKRSAINPNKSLQVPTNNYLKLGSSGDKVLDLQSLLNALGYANSQNGVFDHATLEALRAFQKQNNLNVDGIAGPATFSAIEQEMSRHTPFATLWNWLKSVMVKFSKSI
jgi:N-acetylmuramidase/Putative peptidoglycan binding domain